MNKGEKANLANGQRKTAKQVTLCKGRIQLGSKLDFTFYALCFLTIFITMLLSVIFACSGSLATGKMTSHLVQCLLGLLILQIPVFLRSKFNLQIPSYLSITVMVFVISHFVLGEVYRFYDSVFLFDKALHAVAGGMYSLMGVSIFYGFSRKNSGRISPFLVALFSFCFTMTLLAAWEILEYCVDSLIGSNMQRWQDGITELEENGVKTLVTDSAQGSGLIDTMIDLIIGAIGALAASIVFGIVEVKKPQAARFYITKNSADGDEPPQKTEDTSNQNLDLNTEN